MDVVDPDPIPDDAVVELAVEDVLFIEDYLAGKVSIDEFRARYEKDGRIAIPVTIVDQGGHTQP